MTSGYAVYWDIKKHYNKAIFQRRTPLSEGCSQFIMDEQNIKAIIDTLNKERIEDKRYFQETIFSALGTHWPFIVFISSDHIRLREYFHGAEKKNFLLRFKVQTTA